jgi:carotenoid cleavage dioxygenase-like enzyme
MESFDEIVLRARQYIDDPIAPGDWWTPADSELVAAIKLPTHLEGHWVSHPDRRPLRAKHHFDGDGLVLVIRRAE